MGRGSFWVGRKSGAAAGIPRGDSGAIADYPASGYNWECGLALHRLPKQWIAENVLIGKYKVIEHIGRGGMADVYKALHPEMNRVVAIKVLSRALVHSPEMRARFRREARAIGALSHPNIVQVFDFDVVDGVYFMVMEFIDGETLGQRLSDLHARGKRLPLAETLRVTIAVGQAMHYAHEQAMLHRDIKPTNIMFRGDGCVVLTDFGVAKILNATSHITKTGAVAGTPAYMAPEQWTGATVDRRSDIYSLGVVLYQLATGELPFSDETPARLMFRHISDSPTPPRNLCADIPPALEDVIVRSLAKDPRERYQTAQELVDDLSAILYDVESTAPTGVFNRPFLPLAGARDAARRWASADSRRASLLRLGTGVVALILLIVLAMLSVGGLGGGTTAGATPDATGTALAVRVAALESMLTATATPSPTVSPTPTPTTVSPTPSAITPTPRVAAPTVTASPSRTPTREAPSATPLLQTSPTACPATMQLVQDVNYFNTNWWSTVNARFDKTWRLRNDGECAWPQGSALVHVDGDSFGLQEPFEVGPLQAGEEMELSVGLRVPDAPGEYAGRFRLQTLEGEPIGEPLVVRLEARLRVTVTPTAGVAGGPLRIGGYELISWTADPAHHVWRGSVGLWASGGTGQYTWYRDTLDNPLPGEILDFEWGICRDFFGSVWVASGDSVDHIGVYISYPEPCE
jgi:serine/threonine protein kinase